MCAKLDSTFKPGLAVGAQGLPELEGGSQWHWGAATSNPHLIHHMLLIPSLAGWDLLNSNPPGPVLLWGALQAAKKKKNQPRKKA